MRLALYQPDIPQNTGTILRLAACTAVGVDVIGPAGFDMSDRALRRAGLDYAAAAAITRHTGWTAFLETVEAASPTPRIVLLSTRASLRHIDAAYRPDDILLLGRESAGVPDAVHERADLAVRIPLAAGLRSLNVAVAAGIVLSEALRQTDGWGG